MTSINQNFSYARFSGNRNANRSTSAASASNRGQVRFGVCPCCVGCLAVPAALVGIPLLIKPIRRAIASIQNQLNKNDTTPPQPAG